MQTTTYSMRIERLSPGSPAAAMITPAAMRNGYQYGSDERLLTVIGARLTQRQVWARVNEYVRAQWPEDPRPIAGRGYLGHCRVKSQRERLGYQSGSCAWCKHEATTLRYVNHPPAGAVCKECRGIAEGEMEG